LSSIPVPEVLKAVGAVAPLGPIHRAGKVVVPEPPVNHVPDNRSGDVLASPFTVNVFAASSSGTLLESRASATVPLARFVALVGSLLSESVPPESENSGPTVIVSGTPVLAVYRPRMTDCARLANFASVTEPSATRAIESVPELMLLAFVASVVADAANPVIVPAACVPVWFALSRTFAMVLPPS
jgi:hypothetical protein